MNIKQIGHYHYICITRTCKQDLVSQLSSSITHPEDLKLSSDFGLGHVSSSADLFMPGGENKGVSDPVGERGDWSPFGPEVATSRKK